jgi:hypothetical protein
MMHITIEKEKLEQWLEDLEYSDSDKNVIAAIKQALAAQPAVQEHVATLIEHYAFTDGIVRFDGVENMEQLPVGTKFYTTQPAAQRQWVGLTDEEIEACDCLHVLWVGDDDQELVGKKEFARAIEAKLKEKNT